MLDYQAKSWMGRMEEMMHDCVSAHAHVLLRHIINCEGATFTRLVCEELTGRSGGSCRRTRCQTENRTEGPIWTGKEQSESGYSN